MSIMKALFMAPLLLGATLASSSENGAPFQISNLKIQKTAGANVTIAFTVYDPDPLTNATSTCSGSWATGSQGYPQGSYASCGNSTFAWNMEDYTNIKSFVLGIEHAFEDPAVGEPPYDIITNFGNGNVTEPSIICKATSHHHQCVQDDGTTIKAPIYATIAKQR